MNRRLEKSIDTVFLATGPKNYYVSSTLVKEILNHGADISPFVPEAILNRIMELKGKE